VVIAIRIPVCSKLLCIAAVSAMITLTASTADAQQVARNGNRKVSTIGELQRGKLNPNIRRLRGLNFSTLGLFADSEVFGQFNAPQPFIFPLPDFSGAGLDFTGVSFDEYLTLVANSYELTDSSDYLFRFQFQNEVSAVNPGFVPTFDQVVQAHQQDFVNGGGFLPFADPTNPTVPEPKPDPFVPLDPIFTTPLIPKTPVASASDSSPVASAGLLAAEIANASADPDTLAPASASLAESTASNLTLGNWNPGTPAGAVSVVPEPATLGLLALGATVLMARSRRR
jgi:PEP-CTERM motif